MAILADHTNIPSPFSRLKGLLKRCFSPEYRRPRLYLGDHSISYSTQDFVWSKRADEICREELDVSATEILSIMSDGLPENTALVCLFVKTSMGCFIWIIPCVISIALWTLQGIVGLFHRSRKNYILADSMWTRYSIVRGLAEF